MVRGEGAKPTKVLFCSCAYYDAIPQATKEQVFGVLQGVGVEVEAVADLCGLAANGDVRLEGWAQADSLSIVACYPRAIRWLFEAAGTPLDVEKVRFFNMRVQSPAEIREALLDDHVPSESGARALPGKEDGWVPWFPVIDYDRCKNCKQCMNFCLFGVYGLSPEGQVQVQNPSGCKTNCPACARMCPANAIIFPKYAEPPINGDEAGPPVESKEKPAPDLRSLLQGDVYDRIRGRQPGRKRFSTEPKESSSEQPASSLDDLRRELDIPLDVLTSLSPAELQRIRKTSRSDGSTESEGDAAE